MNQFSADYESRLGAIVKAKAEALDAETLALYKDGAEWLAPWLQKYHDRLQPVYIYGTRRQGVLLEWDIGVNMPTIDITFQTKTGVYHNLNLETGVDDCREIDLTDDAGWQQLCANLQSMHMPAKSVDDLNDDH